MDNQEIFEGLVKKLKKHYIEDIACLDKDFDLGEADYRILVTEIKNVLDVSIVDPEKRELWGIEVSFDIIKQIFTNKYFIKDKIDDRHYRTVSKICVFLGYKDFIDYKKSLKRLIESNEYADKIKKEVEAVLIAATDAKLQGYKNYLLLFDLVEPYYVFTVYCELRELMDLTEKLHKLNVVTHRHKKSRYYIYGVELLDYDDKKALVRVDEYWHIEWYNYLDKTDQPESFRKIYEYIFVIEDSKWKILQRDEVPYHFQKTKRTFTDEDINPRSFG